MERLLIMSFIAGLAIGLGGLLVFIIENLSKKLLATILGFSAGIMLFITLFKMLPSSIAKGEILYTIIGLIIGFSLTFVLDRITPHHCFHRLHHQDEDGTVKDNQLIKMGLFIGLGVALHNLVEGLTVGAGHFTEDNLGIFIALALAFHNIPIGIAIATPLKLGNLNNLKIILITILVGLFTPLGAVISLFLYQLSDIFFSLSLALAGGIMLNIIGRELIPESYEYHKGFASLGLILGMVFIQLLHH
ncbi:ZIP family metal transporter [Selenihalanaerobacter shriftii]|uniref:Zinc transporter, ZIP family n=1 Tax=Selenihalanaerobacter shriftii TaxID=142842 RepID=A0A1T4LT81_9FIRM|nr:ZIP family metal transporter [Selenihalanaerobacter shriftii]SJZ57885.1 zinc transporter, ZIP family [Selenihalanaerobacter shriftii]